MRKKKSGRRHDMYEVTIENSGIHMLGQDMAGYTNRMWREDREEGAAKLARRTLEAWGDCEYSAVFWTIVTECAGDALKAAKESDRNAKRDARLTAIEASLSNIEKKMEEEKK